MRSVSLLASLLAIFTAVAFAQTPASEDTLLSRNANLDVRDVSLQTALQNLSLLSGVPIAFSPDLVNRSGPVSCSCVDLTVREALDSLLSGTGLAYNEMSHRVVVGPILRSGDLTEQHARQRPGTLLGEVRAAADSEPIAGAQVQVSGRLGVVLTDSEGRFSLMLPPGPYDVRVQALGFAPQQLRAVTYGHGDTTTVTVLMAIAPIKLAEVVVTPSRYEILDPAVAGVNHTLTRDEINTRPHLGEDVYRTIDRLPGVASHDVTAKVNLRGSHDNEVLQLLDGLEIYEPFHLKDIDGALSIIDLESVEDIRLSTGGFTAEHGDKLAGVLSMRSKVPRPDRTSTTIGASFMNLGLKSQGGFAAGRGTWLASARRGFLDIFFGIIGVDEDISPTYYDLFTKVQYQLSPGHLISAHVLHAGDRFSMVEDDATEIESKWGSSYAWVNWRADLTAALSAETIVSAVRMMRERSGRDFVVDPRVQTLSLDDRGSFASYGFRQDWSLLASERLLVRWGFDFKHGLADYDYSRWRLDWIPNLTDPAAPLWTRHDDSLTVAATPASDELGVYVSNRLRLIDRLTVEVGIRYDRQSHTGDNKFSPRVNAALEVAPRTTLRGAWGMFYQSHDLQQLDVANGDGRFYPAQRAEHRILGLSHRLRSGTSLRLEAYEMRISDPWPEYRDLQPERTDVVPEETPWDIVRVDPARAAIRGLEFLVKRDVGGRFAWSASYALAVAEDQIDGVWVPRPFDQRHTVHLEFGYAPNPGWSFACGWHYHSPWPYTAQRWEAGTLVNGQTFAQRTFGPINGERLPPYHRLDLRVSRHVPLGRGRLSIFLDIFNFYGRRNAETVDYLVSIYENQLSVRTEIEDMVGVLPNIGARWEF